MFLVTGYQGRNKLTMMVIPSIFIPEDWSFTFYEGLNRHPDSIFKDKTVSELGCGNGWISIAIAEKWAPLKVVLHSPTTKLINAMCSLLSNVLGFLCTFYDRFMGLT